MCDCSGANQHGSRTEIVSDPYLFDFFLPVHGIRQLKQQVVTAQYAKSLRKLVEIVLEYDSADSPFAKRERKALMDLFERAAVIQHSVFKVWRVLSVPVWHRQVQSAVARFSKVMNLFYAIRTTSGPWGRGESRAEQTQRLSS